MAHRILIVEDDPSQQGVLRFAFERRGFAVETADDGLSAVRMMQHQAYDLALIDYQLPEIDGLASARLTKYLLGDAKRPRLIAVTGQADALTAQDGHGNTFDAILPKPFDLAVAIRLVEDQLATTRAASPLHRRWEAFGLTEAPSAVVYPAIDRERLSILSQYFDMSGRSEPQAILLADAAGATEIEMLKLNGDLWTLPVIDLSGVYESIADASFSDHDRQDWTKVAEAIRRFKKRRAALAPQSLQTCDLSTRLLVYLHLAGRNWAPVRDASVTSCLRYPGFFPTVDVQACAQRLYAKGLLERTFIDRLHVCPSCASSRLNAREECLSCRSPNLTETSIIHHYRCAHQAIEDEFVQGRDLVCPKCRQHLRHYGNDYDKPGHALTCGECSATHSDAAVGFVCFDCGAHCDGEAIPRRDVFAYQLTAAAYATITAPTSPALSSRLPSSLPDDLVDELERQSANDDAPVCLSIVEVHYAARSALVNARGLQAFERARAIFVHNLIGSSSVHVSVFAGPTSDFLKAPVPQSELISALDPATLQAAQDQLGFNLQPQVRELDLERQVQRVRV